MTDWFKNMPPRASNSIAPVRQDDPSFWFVRVTFVVVVAPLVVFVLWAWMC